MTLEQSSNTTLRGNSPAGCLIGGSTGTEQFHRAGAGRFRHYPPPRIAALGLNAGQGLVWGEQRLCLDQTAQHVNRYTGKGRVIDVQRQAHDLTPRGEFQRGFNRLEQSSIGLGIKKGPALDVQCRHTFLGQQQPHLSIAKIKPSGHPCTDP